MHLYLVFLKVGESDIYLKLTSIMQKLINVLAIVSFGVSAGVVVGGAYVYTQKDALIESVKENITKEIQGIVGSALGDGLNSGVPGGEVPTTLPAPIPNSPF